MVDAQVKRDILLVDDDSVIVAAIGSDLEEKGYRVTTAGSGEQAVDWLTQSHFDLVITDLVMTPVNGIAVLEKAKEIDPDTMVVILTGFGDMTSAIEALRSGADDYLLKPCEPEEIDFRVSRCLKKQEFKRKLKAYENILPVCCVCKKIRDDSGREPGTGVWMSMEEYMLNKAKVAVTSTYCPECLKRAMDDIDEEAGHLEP
jgi:DNA-binding NtrC family response regulator